MLRPAIPEIEQEEIVVFFDLNLMVERAIGHVDLL